MPILTQTYSANTAITLDLSVLATSSTGVGGRESTQIDNTSTQYMDVLVQGKVILGHASTAPAVGQQIVVYVWGADTSLATTSIDTLVGTDAARTLAHAGVLANLRWAATAAVTEATAGLGYYFLPFGVAALFGGTMPKFWGLYVTHNHNGVLAASMSGKFSFNGITFTST